MKLRMINREKLSETNVFITWTALRNCKNIFKKETRNERLRTVQLRSKLSNKAHAKNMLDNCFIISAIKPIATMMHTAMVSRRNSAFVFQVQSIGLNTGNFEETEAISEYYIYL